MNWYNIIKTSGAFLDRNDINKRIRIVRNIIVILKKCIKYVPQNPPDAQKMVEKIANDKFMSSYPDQKKKLLESCKRARDNYKQFSTTCEQIMNYMYQEMKKLEKKRREVVDKLTRRVQRWKDKDNG